MRKSILESLKNRFESYNDIAESLNDQKLGEKIDAPKHKSLLEHVWCVIGARESYAKAIENGEWSGFTCSMSKYTTLEVIEKLRSSAENFLAVANNVTEWTDEREELLLKLSEHEVMHEGGIIRHMYAIEIDIPTSVQWA
ncbi:MAG: hypothetical protein ACI9HA_002301 [Dinoroseobacter sp.]|jgi:hypothetical protein